MKLLVRVAVVWLLVAALEGGAWAWLAPLVRSWSDGTYERQVSGDITFAGLQLLVGLGAALIVLARPGRGSLLRFGTALTGSAVASFAAWGTGRLLGAPVIVMVAVLVLAPLTLALITVVGTLAATIVLREPFGADPRPTISAAQQEPGQEPDRSHPAG